MPKLEEVKITTGNPGTESAYHYIRSTQGHLNASHQFLDNSYEILDYFVGEPYLRQGYGKELLRLALEHARAIGATAITASHIASRESVHALSSVFGTASLRCDESDPSTSESTPFQNTSMRYEINPDNPQDITYAKLAISSIQSIHPTICAFNEDIVTLSTQIRSIDEKTGGRFWQLDDSDRQALQTLYDLRGLMFKYRDRSEQKIDAHELNYELKYSDEIAFSDYSHILEIPDLPDNFRVLDGVDISSKKQAYFALENLPFYNLEGRAYTGPYNKPAEQIIGPIDFPVDRIVGVDSFQSWSGRGLYLNDRNPDYSLEKIVKFAQVPGNKFKRLTSAAIIIIVKDIENNLWGIATNDGSHRTAAAKLRGDKYLEVSEIHIPDISDMTTIPFRIKV